MFYQRTLPYIAINYYTIYKKYVIAHPEFPSQGYRSHKKQQRGIKVK